jgi:hypothetical protein
MGRYGSERAYAPPDYPAAEPALHRRDPREATGRAGRPEEGGRDCCTQRLGAAAMVETERMAGRHPQGGKIMPADF